ncbi:MAG: YceI family protein [Saprospiraceae bacterium]|nr:YceI family protein [Saprospiraceae bacterium]
MRQLSMHIILTLLFLSFVGFGSVTAQAKFTAKNTIHLTVSGTSTLHDWVMKTSEGTCLATLVLDADGSLKDFTSMSFSVPSKTLKSGKDGMDKNAYKALKADKNPTISATLKSAEVTAKDDKTYSIKAMVSLTIAGKTIDTQLEAEAKKSNDNSFAIKGDKKISMKEYGMDPPSFMLGAVKTGNDVVLHYDLVLNQ